MRKFIPMLYSTPMVQALRNGTKTKTRRTQGLEVVNDEEAREIYDWHFFSVNKDEDGKTIYVFKAGNGFSDAWLDVYPKVNVGDVIWVRETFFNSEANFVLEAYAPDFVYKADNENYKLNGEQIKWQPSLFMPKKACRMWLEVTGVRVEKLQDISETDAVNEGIYDMFHGKDIAGNAYFNYMDKKGGWDSVADNAIHSFSTLWESINGKGSWDANPFVWVYDFKVMHERPEGFLNG